MKNINKIMSSKNKFISSLLASSMFYTFLPMDAFALTVNNIAQTTYKNQSDVSYSGDSNEVISQITAQLPKEVRIQPLFNSVDGVSHGTWTNPAHVINTGTISDAYTISVTNIPTGMTYVVYSDQNDNGIIDAGDVPITTTPTLAANGSYPVIFVFTDTVGLPVGSIVNPNITATSTSDVNIKNTQDFNLIVKGGGGGGHPFPTYTPTPLPTPTPTPSIPNNFPAILKKTVFPTGSVKAGDTLSYYLEFTNKNSYAAKDVTINDVLSGSLTYVTDSASLSSINGDGKVSYSSGSTGGGNLKFSWSTVQPNETVNVSFRAKILDTLEGGNVENLANASYTPDTGNPKVTPTTQSVMSNMVVNTIKNLYSVDGKIINKKTGLPEEGDKVVVYDKDGNVLGEDITGKTGTYHIPVDNKGEYKVIYRDKNGNIINEARADVKVPGINNPPIQIMGKVLNSQTKAAIADAKLELLGDNGQVIFTLNTDKDGNYFFDKDTAGAELKPGKYTIRVINANGDVSYARVNVTVAPGDVIVNLEILIDPFGIVYDDLGGLDVRIKGAQVKLLSNCNDLNSVVALDKLDGTDQTNPFTTNEKGVYQYFLNQEQLNNKNYCLDVVADGYKERQFLVRTAPSKELIGKSVLEITDESNKKTLIQNIESIPYNVALTPLKTLDINKVANKSSIEIGDVVTYTVEASNKLKFKVTNGFITDKLPFGFKYVPDTLFLNGKAVKNFSAVDELKVPVGDLNADEKVTLLYQTRTGIRVPEGPSINRALASATSPQNKPIVSDVATATVFVKKGVFSKNGAIIGKVFVDTNNNGIQDNNEAGVPNIALYTATGIRILTDSKGKYSVPDIQNGEFMLGIDLTSLPKGFELPKVSTWIGQDDISKRVYIPESGLAKVNFRLVKSDDALVVLPPKETTLKAVYVFPDKFAIKQIPFVTYPDIADHWAKGVIQYESGLEIIHGYPDGNFKPSRSISRAETTALTLVALKSFDIKMGTTLGYILNKDAKVTVKILDANDQEVKMFHQGVDKKAGINQIYWDGNDKNGNIAPNGLYKLEVTAEDKDGTSSKLLTSLNVVPATPNYRPEGKADFKDVPEKHWANKYIKVGTDEKLVTGYVDNTFKPDNFIPRYEMAVIAVHALNLDINDGKEELPFADSDQVPQWAKKYVYLAYNKGLLPKFPDNKFYPMRNISRAEIAMFVNELINKQKIDVSVSGTVDPSQNSLTIEGKTVDLSKEKTFTLPLNKESSQALDIVVPDVKLETIDDTEYARKNVKDNRGGTK